MRSFILPPSLLLLDHRQPASHMSLGSGETCSHDFGPPHTMSMNRAFLQQGCVTDFSDSISLWSIGLAISFGNMVLWVEFYSTVLLGISWGCDSKMIYALGAMMIGLVLIIYRLLLGSLWWMFDPVFFHFGSWFYMMA